MFDNLRQDARRMREGRTRRAPWYVIESLLLDNGFQAVVLYRIAHWFKARRIPLFGPLVHRCAITLTGVDISPGARIGPGFCIGHGLGLVIGGSVVIGANATLLQQVTIGAPAISRRDEMPTIGDGVFVAAGARLIGRITIGDRVFIGANALVTEDIPSDAKVVTTAGIEVRGRVASSAGRGAGDQPPDSPTLTGGSRSPSE